MCEKRKEKSVQNVVDDLEKYRKFVFFVARNGFDIAEKLPSKVWVTRLRSPLPPPFRVKSAAMETSPASRLASASAAAGSTCRGGRARGSGRSSS